MKKLLAILLAVLMMAAFTACGDDSAVSDLQDAADTTSKLVSDILNGDADPDDLEDTMNQLESAAQNAGVKLDTEIADYAKQLSESAEFKQTVETMKQQFLNVVVTSDGDDLVYRYTYTVEVDKELVKQALQQSASTYEASANALRAMLSKLNKVVIEFYSMDGALIVSDKY